MNVDLSTVALVVVPLLLAVVCHEWAHGYVAYRLGDDTAAQMGRLTLNPLPHVDPFGTILIPGMLILSGSPFLFGYAKPVPVAWHRLRNPARDMVWVAVAGPAMNLALAVGSAVLLAVLARLPEASSLGGAHAAFDVFTPLAGMCWVSLRLNIVLAVFNLLPIPPLDGGRVAVGLLPPALAEPVARVEPFGMLVLLVLLFSGMLGVLIGGPIQFLVRLLSF